MIYFKHIEQLGFKKESSKDTVYEEQHGRPYWYMVFNAEVHFIGGKNDICMTWTPDDLQVKVFVNEKPYKTFTDIDRLNEFFKLFEK